MAVVAAVAVSTADLLDGVLSLHDQNVQPVANIGGNHVHQAEPGHQLVLVNVHLKLSKFDFSDRLGTM